MVLVSGILQYFLKKEQHSLPGAHTHLKVSCLVFGDGGFVCLLLACLFFKTGPLRVALAVPELTL